MQMATVGDADGNARRGAKDKNRSKNTCRWQRKSKNKDRRARWQRKSENKNRAKNIIPEQRTEW